MILEIFSIQTRERVGMINVYEFAQYTQEFCGSGSFSVKVSLSDKSVRFLNNKHFILFDDGVLGIIRYRSKETEESSTVEVCGFLVNKILDWRSFLVTKSFNGTVSEISRSIVDFFFINNPDERRNISFISLDPDEKYSPSSSSSSLQNTGNSVAYVLSSFLGSFEYGYTLYPVVNKYSEGSETNISTLSFRVLKPSDRTIDNKENNSPVVFSRQMNNLSNMIYIEDDTEYCSTAIVAGEGEGSSRTTVEVGNTASSGIDRIELYVDARDLQSKTEDRTLTQEEYIEVLSNRGYSYLEDHMSFSSIDGTIIDGASSYKYGVDFFLGDYVSIIDEEFGLVVNTQIQSVTKSQTEFGEKLDFTFGKERVSIQKAIRKRGLV